MPSNRKNKKKKEIERGVLKYIDRNRKTRKQGT
jgi:hypothetical protein